MYTFFVKKSSSNSYIPYTEIVDVTTQDAYGNNLVTKVAEGWSTEDLVELSAKYVELLKSYTTEQIKIVQELEPSILVDIVD